MDSIGYDVRGIFRVLWKRIWLVLILAALFGAVSIPIANASYANAVADYNRLTTEQPVVASDEAKSTIKGTYSSYYVLKYEENDKIPLDIYMGNILNFMDSDLIKKAAWEKILSIPGFQSYNDTIRYVDVNSLPTTSTLWLSFSDTTETAGQTFSDAWIENGLVAASDVFSYPDTYEKKYATFIPDTEVENLTNLSVAKLQELTRPPTKNTNYVRIIGTAVVFGVFFSCFLILLVDFIRHGKKEE